MFGEVPISMLLSLVTLQHNLRKHLYNNAFALVCVFADMLYAFNHQSQHIPEPARPGLP